MKGVELPINILVVVAIAVIVLLGLVALYFIGFTPFSLSAGIEAIKNGGCRTYLNQNPVCNSSAAFNVSYQGASISFYGFMTNADTYNCPDEACIRQRCTCPGY